MKKLYAGDAVLSQSLSSALETETRARAAMDDMPKDAKDKGNKLAGGYGNLTPLFDGAGRLLANENGPRIAVLDASGWDTHFNEGTADGQLGRRLAALDAALDVFRSSLGPAWNKTAVVMATEFGRTVKPNGSGGTDHGTGGAAFLFGGAVAGGKVRAEWTGLKPEALKDGRDQPARTDLRALFKGVLAEHLGVSESAVNAKVFPDSGAVAPLDQLLRA